MKLSDQAFIKKHLSSFHEIIEMWFIKLDL